MVKENPRTGSCDSVVNPATHIVPVIYKRRNLVNFPIGSLPLNATRRPKRIQPTIAAEIAKGSRKSGFGV